MVRSFGFALIAALLAVPAVAAETQPVAQDRNTEVICKDVATEPGSRLGIRKVCLPRAEWERRRQRDADRLTQSQDNGLLATQN
jgi:hypothetical protein